MLQQNLLKKEQIKAYYKFEKKLNKLIPQNNNWSLIEEHLTKCKQYWGNDQMVHNNLITLATIVGSYVYTIHDPYCKITAQKYKAGKLNKEEVKMYVKTRNPSLLKQIDDENYLKLYKKEAEKAKTAKGYNQANQKSDQVAKAIMDLSPMMQ